MAPRLKASRPREPAPAYQSIQDLPVRCPVSKSKIDCRTRSVTGLELEATLSLVFLAVPAIIRGSLFCMESEANLIADYSDSCGNVEGLLLSEHRNLDALIT